PGAQAPTDLGAISGTTDTVAWGCNSSGQVCGAGYASNFVTTAFVGSVTGGIQMLTYVPGQPTEAFGINEAGGVAGTVGGIDGMPRAAIWQAGAGWHLIQLEPTATGSYARCANNSGWIVGEQIIAGLNQQRATVWDPSETAIELPSPE